MKMFVSKNNKHALETDALAEEWKLPRNLSRKEQKGLEIIRKHAGKRMVFETYMATNPVMAEKYLVFVAHNQYARYIKWDNNRQQFTVAS
ncbi:MAG TPA: hypothetical protein PLR01_11960 [Bacteroidales bacterium]|jgi:hypothetical protein|nr:hypothetical protein [Bacteroidales bacterium]HPI87083.1 hypothetical protein [Bacteroidales bacterium]